MLDSLVEVGDAHRFDVKPLERYMRAHIEGAEAPLQVRQFRGGQSNPTYYVTAGGKELVLRRKPPGRLLPSAHAVDREYRVITALAGTDVPVPRTYAFCPDESVIGTPFYIMECVHGRIFRDPRLLEVERGERPPIYAAMLDVLARLHRLDWHALGLADFGKPANYFARQIYRWTSQYRASETETIPSMEQLIEWMPAHVPEDDETTIVHGDYRLGNMVIHPTEPRVLAVLDWELSTLGHPLADLAYTCMPYHLGKDGHSLQDTDPRELGLPTESETVAQYCRLAGRAEIADWDFYIAFSLFRLAAISQGIMGRVLAGTANDPDAREHGVRARALAERAWAVLDSRARR